MAKNKRGGLGVGGVDALFQPTGQKPSAEKKTNGTNGRKATRKSAAPRTHPEQTEKLTVHIPRRQIAGLEKLKARERAQGKRRGEATITALVIEAIDLLLKRRA
jgi:hypothetical protein